MAKEKLEFMRIPAIVTRDVRYCGGAFAMWW